MSDTKLEELLGLVADYVQEKKKNKKWQRGKDLIYYSGPFFNEEEYVRAVKTLLSGWLGLGKDAITFERMFCKELGKGYGVLTNSGSSANLLMVSLLTSPNGFKLPKYSRVIVPVASFPTTLNPILQLGLEPVFVDIDLDSLAPNLDAVEKAAKTSDALMFAHPLGNSPNMDRVMDIVQGTNIILLEDCCDALGSTYCGKPLGSFGDMSTCSFYPAHHMTIGEGGFVGVKTKHMENVARSLRDWGKDCVCAGEASHTCINGVCGKRFSNWIPELPHASFDHKYLYSEIGYNLKPMELQASIGLAQIKKLPEIHALRRRNHAALHSIFKPYEEHFILPTATANCSPSWFCFAVTIKKDAPFNRKKICEYLEQHKIETRMFFGGNLLLQPAYKGLGHGLDYPNATHSMTSTFFLGTSPVVTLEQIDYIKEIVDQFFKHEIQ
jgi:CDP-6-deoxy-D-xylo-4-hexulose-3-dehydrase